ncbi:MAG: fused DSP-PTPase phosphatase/NAD kinase-like protein, partial [Phycisphaerales bacterium]
SLGGCVLDTRDGGPTTKAYSQRVYSTPTGLNAERPLFPREYETPAGEFANGAWRAGDVFVTGQPDEPALKHLLEDEGVTLVVNLRTPSEMERMEDADEDPFNEAAFIRPYTVEYGVEYVELPIGGEDNPPTPAQVDAFAEALARHESAALLKCASGGRSSQMWAAYLVRHKGFEVNEARRHAMAMSFSPSVMERLLDVEFEYDIKQ